MSFVSEFKEFAMKGNVVDMAVGVIIGAAFGAIVSSLVGDIVMPPLGMAIGGVNFTDLAITLGTNPATGQPVVVKYGAFLQKVFDFLIIAMVLFLAIRGINALKKPAVAAAPATPADVVLLTEIRDLLAKQSR
ncbi:MAG TPA: large-conductance mechanosensitive channel protein MscL [Steroidobacteraceae bacterium]|nr:large-conductance mechanosensitive channel protein MscL [Steroidobacteraceae bacterium]